MANTNFQVKNGLTVGNVNIAASSGIVTVDATGDRKSTRLNSSHIPLSRMPSSA